MPSASNALRSKWIGSPNELVPSYDGLHAGPDRAADGGFGDPSSARSAACPAAVPPPWLPIAATTNGSNPSERTASAAAPAIGPIWAIPRLPAVIATRRARSQARGQAAAADGFRGGGSDVGDGRLLEAAAHAGDRGKGHQVAFVKVSRSACRGSV